MLTDEALGAIMEAAGAREAFQALGKKAAWTKPVDIMVKLKREGPAFFCSMMALPPASLGYAILHCVYNQNATLLCQQD